YCSIFKVLRRAVSRLATCLFYHIRLSLSSSFLKLFASSFAFCGRPVERSNIILHPGAFVNPFLQILCALLILFKNKGRTAGLSSLISLILCSGWGDGARPFLYLKVAP